MPSVQHTKKTVKKAPQKTAQRTKKRTPEENAAIAEAPQMIKKNSKKNAPRIVGAIFTGLFSAAVLMLLIGLLVMALWNALMPSIFGVSAIGYWQAVGLTILVRVMVAPFKPRIGEKSRGPKAHCMPDDEEMWKVKGGADKWRYYGEYWKREGKEAFEAYVKTSKGKKNATKK